MSSILGQPRKKVKLDDCTTGTEQTPAQEKIETKETTPNQLTKLGNQLGNQPIFNISGGNLTFNF